MTNLVAEIEVQQVDLVHYLIARLDALLLFDISDEMPERVLMPPSDGKIEFSRSEITAHGLRTTADRTGSSYNAALSIEFRAGNQENDRGERK